MIIKIYINKSGKVSDLQNQKIRLKNTVGIECVVLLYRKIIMV